MFKYICLLVIVKGTVSWDFFVSLLSSKSSSWSHQRRPIGPFGILSIFCRVIRFWSELPGACVSMGSWLYGAFDTVESRLCGVESTAESDLHGAASSGESTGELHFFTLKKNIHGAFNTSELKLCGAFDSAESRLPGAFDTMELFNCFIQTSRLSKCLSISFQLKKKIYNNYTIIVLDGQKCSQF